jgi:mannitol/fructose-specific phosphotransferase system IIA component (Ntr-type)
LSEIVSAQAIVPALTASDRDGVVTELVDALVAAGSASATIRDELISRVLDRERRGSTGFGQGVAVPHVKHKGVQTLVAAVGISPRGVDFNSLDRQPVYSVFLLLSPEDRPDEHLQAMEVIFRQLSKDTFRYFLRQCESVKDVTELLEEADGQSLG